MKFFPLAEQGAAGRRYAGHGVHANTQRHRGAAIGNRAKAASPSGNLQQPVHGCACGRRSTVRTADPAVSLNRVCTPPDRRGRDGYLRSTRGTPAFTPHAGPHHQPTSVRDRPATWSSAEGRPSRCLEGGQPVEIRMRLPAPDPTEAMPKDLQELGPAICASNYVECRRKLGKQGPTGAWQHEALRRPARRLQQMAFVILPRMERHDDPAVRGANAKHGTQRVFSSPPVTLPFRSSAVLCGSLLLLHPDRYGSACTCSLAGTAGGATRNDNGGLRAGPANRPTSPSVVVQNRGAPPIGLSSGCVLIWVFLKDRAAGVVAERCRAGQRQQPRQTRDFRYYPEPSFTSPGKLSDSRRRTRCLVFLVRLLGAVLMLPRSAWRLHGPRGRPWYAVIIRRFAAGANRLRLSPRQGGLMPLVVLPWRVLPRKLADSVSPI